MGELKGLLNQAVGDNDRYIEIKNLNLDRDLDNELQLNFIDALPNKFGKGNVYSFVFPNEESFQEVTKAIVSYLLRARSLYSGEEFYEHVVKMSSSECYRFNIMLMNPHARTEEEKKYATDVKIEITHEIGQMSGGFRTIHITGICPYLGDVYKRIRQMRENLELEED